MTYSACQTPTYIRDSSNITVLGNLIYYYGTPLSAPNDYEKGLQAEKKRIENEKIGALVEKILSLKGCSDNWDGFGSARPKKISIERAINWINYIFLALVSFQFPWVQPAVGVDEDGDIEFEWWNSDKKLTLDINETEIYFTQIDGPGLSPKITQRSFLDLTENERVSLIQWIMTKG